MTDKLDRELAVASLRVELLKEISKYGKQTLSLLSIIESHQDKLGQLADLVGRLEERVAQLEVASDIRAMARGERE